MATKRRSGGGFRPPEIRGTLGTLLRSAIQQAGGVRDALERGAREGRNRLDSLRADRRRNDALAELGEVVLELIRNGEIDVAELPEAKDLVRFLDELDAEREPTENDSDDVATPRTRARFDDRGPPSRATPPRRREEDDGTVGSGARWSPPKVAKPAAVWRPPADDDAAEPAAKPRRAAPSLPKDPHRKGGINFDDDSDLADYMHPDDVPPKSNDDER